MRAFRAVANREWAGAESCCASPAELSRDSGKLTRHKGEWMADKSKKSVADILAAARKADAKSGAPSTPPAEAAPDEAAASAATEKPAAPLRRNRLAVDARVWPR